MTAGGASVDAEVPAAGAVRRFALVRHPAAAVAAGVCYGRMDVAPGAGAADDCAAIAARLRGFPASALLTSPARRCRMVAEVLAETLRLPVVTDARLLELHFGDWEGTPWDAVPRAALDRWAADPAGFAPPGGESGAALLARVAAVAAELRGGTVVVAHGGPLKLLAALLRGEAPDLLAPAPALGSVTEVTAPQPPR